MDSPCHVPVCLCVGVCLSVSVSLCVYVCVCLVPIAQGVCRYNECSQQHVWLLYLGQLRTGSRASHHFCQLYRLNLVSLLAPKLTSAAKSDAAGNAFPCLTQCGSTHSHAHPIMSRRAFSCSALQTRRQHATVVCYGVSIHPAAPFLSLSFWVTIRSIMDDEEGFGGEMV